VIENFKDWATVLPVTHSILDPQRDEKDDENGHFHNLAGSVKRIFDGNSTIATDDHTSASPDFVSLDGSAQTGGPPSNEIEMEYQGPSSDYAV
jgi:hypothetical protein